MAAEEDIGVSGDMNQKMEWSIDRIGRSIESSNATVLAGARGASAARARRGAGPARVARGRERRRAEDDGRVCRGRKRDRDDARRRQRSIAGETGGRAGRSATIRRFVRARAKEEFARAFRRARSRAATRARALPRAERGDALENRAPADRTARNRRDRSRRSASRGRSTTLDRRARAYGVLYTFAGERNGTPTIRARARTSGKTTRAARITRGAIERRRATWTSAPWCEDRASCSVRP